MARPHSRRYVGKDDYQIYEAQDSHSRQFFHSPLPLPLPKGIEQPICIDFLQSNDDSEWRIEFVKSCDFSLTSNNNGVIAQPALSNNLAVDTLTTYDYSTGMVMSTTTPTSYNAGCSLTDQGTVCPQVSFSTSLIADFFWYLEGGTKPLALSCTVIISPILKTRRHLTEGAIEQTFTTTFELEPKETDKTWMWIAIGAAASLLLCCSLFAFAFCRRRRENDDDKKQQDIEAGEKVVSVNTGSDVSGSDQGN